MVATYVCVCVSTNDSHHQAAMSYSLGRGRESGSAVTATKWPTSGLTEPHTCIAIAIINPKTLSLMIMIWLFQEVLSATRCLRGTKEVPPMSSTTGTMTGSGGGTGDEWWWWWWWWWFSIPNDTILASLSVWPILIRNLSVTVWIETKHGKMLGLL